MPFMKRTRGEASTAFWICARASEERSRRRADEVVAGDPRVKGASWGKNEYTSTWTLLSILSPTESLEIDLNILYGRYTSCAKGISETVFSSA